MQIFQLNMAVKLMYS